MIIRLPYILFLLLFFTFIKTFNSIGGKLNVYEGSKKKRTAVKEEGEGSTTPKGKGPGLGLVRVVLPHFSSPLRAPRHYPSSPLLLLLTLLSLISLLSL